MSKKIIFIIFVIILGGIVFRLITHNTKTTNSLGMTNIDNLRHLVIKIDGMYCVSCPYNIENAIKDIKSVVNVTVGFVGKKIINGTVEGRGEVIYNASQTNINKIIQAISPYKTDILSDNSTKTTELAPLAKTIEF